MGDIHDLSAVEQAAAIRRRELSPVELTDHYLDRIERHNDTVGAYVTIAADLAREHAKAAERALADRPDELPPLHGVPIAIKDLNMVEGVRCMLGSTAFQDFVAPLDDHVVTLTVRRGAMPLLGKTNTPEFGAPCYTESNVAPPARTPYDLARSAGGSSGGAAAAVAAGLAPIAQGNDGGGSVRIPASACGLVGLKVSRGRISNGPIQGDVSGLAWNGPLARTVSDAATLLDLMAGPMPGDPHWAPPLPAGDTFAAHADREPPPLRIARFATPVIADTEIHPDCHAAYERASTVLAALGHEVVDIDPPMQPDAIGPFENVWAVLATLAPVDPAREDRLMPLTRWLRERGRGVSGTDFAMAVAGMQGLVRLVLTEWQDYDAILTPTLAQPPSLIGSIRDDANPAADFEAQKAFTPFTAAYNVSGQPAISLPLHWTDGGLPIGIMLAGRPAGEAQLIELAAQLEAAQPWRDRHPPIW